MTNRSQRIEDAQNRARTQIAGAKARMQRATTNAEMVEAMNDITRAQQALQHASAQAAI